MPRYLITLGVIVSVIGLIGVTLFLVSQASATTVSTRISSAQQPHSAWGLVMGNGFGDPFNQMLNTLQEFDGQLYAGTTNPYGAEIWRSPDGLYWSPAITGGMTNTMLTAHVLDLAVFNDQLYAAAFVSGQGGSIWRSPNGIAWTRVVSVNGLGQGELQSFALMTPYSNSLYVANTANAYGDQALWETADGLSWQPITTTGLMTAALTSMSVFSEHLYIATSDYSAGAVIWRSNGLTWETVVTGGFGITQNTSIEDLGVFDNQLYAITTWQIWRSANGVDWTQVISDGLGSPPHDLYGANLIVFNDNAFLFTGFPGKDNNLVYRSANGSDWDLITFDAWSEARHSSLMEPITVFNGRLLVGTGNLTVTTGCQLWSYLTNAAYLPVIAQRN